MTTRQGRGREAASDATAALDQRGTITLSSEEPAVGGEVWQWESSPAHPDPVWSSIAGASAASYTPVAGDRGGLLRATTVVYTDGSGALMDLDGMVSNEVWKWERSPRAGTPDWEVITGATTSAYTPTAEDDGGMILLVAVGYDDAFGTGRGAVSPSTLVVDRLGVITLTTSMPQVGEALTATLTDGDGGVLNAVWKWEESSPDEDPRE